LQAKLAKKCIFPLLPFKIEFASHKCRTSTPAGRMNMPIDSVAKMDGRLRCVAPVMFGFSGS
jgi:hypothetical protein